MAHPYAAHREHKAGKARAHHISGLKSGGRAKHSDAAEDRKMIKHAVHAHEAHMHGGKAKTRLDKFARGGKTKDKHHTQVNVAVVAPHHKSPGGAGAPPDLGATPPAPPPVGGPPPGMGAPPPMGAPMGGPPPGSGMPPMKRGGRAYKSGGGIKMKGGAMSGEGRLAKAKAAAKANHRD